MNERRQTMIASCVVCTTLLLPHSSHAAPPTSGSKTPTVALEVDVENLGDRGIGLDQTVRAQLGPRIVQAGYELVAADGATVVLQVRFRALQSGDYDYGVHFEFVQYDEREPALEWVDCHMCVDARLMPLLAEQTPALLAALDARITGVAPEPAPAPAPALVPDDDAQTVSAPNEAVEQNPRRFTSLGTAGSVLGGVGIVTLIGAGVELSRGLVAEQTGREQLQRIDHRPAGYVLLGVGTTALAAGITMVLVDVSRRTHFYPLATRDGAGLGVSGTF